MIEHLIGNPSFTALTAHMKPGVSPKAALNRPLEMVSDPGILQGSLKEELVRVAQDKGVLWFKP